MIPSTRSCDPVTIISVGGTPCLAVALASRIKNGTLIDELLFKPSSELSRSRVRIVHSRYLAWIPHAQPNGASPHPRCWLLLGAATRQSRRRSIQRLLESGRLVERLGVAPILQTIEALAANDRLLSGRPFTAYLTNGQASGDLEAGVAHVPARSPLQTKFGSLPINVLAIALALASGLSDPNRGRRPEIRHASLRAAENDLRMLTA